MVEGFYNKISNLINLEPDPASGLTHFVNQGPDRSRGAEFELQLKTTRGWSARSSYAYSSAHDEIRLLPLANSPSHSAKLNAGIPLPHKTLAGVELLYRSAQQSYQGTRVSPWLLTNVTFSTKPLGRSWEFSASCYNLFNRNWYSPAGVELRSPEILQDGRTYRFAIAYRSHHEDG